jgi:PIN domain nuclease of toxin-antitoxin system
VILLDTHVLVWMVSSPSELLSRAATREIRKAQREGGCAIASIKPLGVGRAKGRLRASGTVEGLIREIVDSAEVSVLEIPSDIAGLAMAFPEPYPKDPEDRLIGATARARRITLITQDERILASPLVRSIW